MTWKKVDADKFDVSKYTQFLLEEKKLLEETRNATTLEELVSINTRQETIRGEYDQYFQSCLE